MTSTLETTRDRGFAGAHWLAELRQNPPNTVHKPRKRFEISAWQAAETAERMHEIRICRRALLERFP